jgi:hypothetical protein
MTPENLVVGKTYSGSLPDSDIAVFEFSKSGPELRLCFSSIPDEIVRAVEESDCYIGAMQVRDLGVVLWKIGDAMAGDAQFHVFLYPPETRPTPEVLNKDIRYTVWLTLIDRQSRVVRAVRRLRLSHKLSAMLNEIVAYQHGNHIGREEYDAQVSEYQTRYPDVAVLIHSTETLEKAEPARESD